MDKLENYLDRVCRSISGPRSLRQHIRQELREHLLDALAQHKVAGLSEEEALARALEEFGKPEDVRSELEATHGHRMMAVVIDKAMQWKESTMKAKWLWTSWAYLSLAGVIVLESLLITFIVVFIIPKFQKLFHDGYIDAGIIEEHGMMWMPAFLDGVKQVGGHYTTQLLLLAAVFWGLFEWRVRSENKSFMRLSALGTAALALMAVVVITAAALVISFTLAMPEMARMARPWAVEQVAAIDTAVGSLEQALAKKDWQAMPEHAEQAAHALSRLSAGPALTSLTRWNEPPALEELRAQVHSGLENLGAVRQAIAAEDSERLHAALRQFHNAWDPLRDAAKRARP